VKLLVTTVVRSLVIYDSQALTRQEFRKSVPSRAPHNIGVSSGIRREIRRSTAERKPARSTTVNKEGKDS